MFELRKDAITGWWVAVVVDRAYDRRRFARPAEPVRSGRAVSPAGLEDAAPVQGCANCIEPAGGGVRLRVLKPHAFSVAGTEREARERDAHEREGRDGGGDGGATQQGLGLVADVGSWATVVAPPGHHGPLAREDPSVATALLAGARDAIRVARDVGQTDYVQVVQNWGRQAGALTDHLCLDLYDLPQVPHRVGEELGGAARFLIREGVCPWCQLLRDEPASGRRLVLEDEAAVCFAPYASRSPFELWVVPRRHAADFGDAADGQLEAAAVTLQAVLRLLEVLDGPAYNLVLHTAPLRERVDETFHWHWEVHPRLREIAGLELGTGLPVNPISPEEAVADLLAASGAGRPASQRPASLRLRTTDWAALAGGAPAGRPSAAPKLRRPGRRHWPSSSSGGGTGRP